MKKQKKKITPSVTCKCGNKIIYFKYDPIKAWEQATCNKCGVNISVRWRM